MIRHAAISARQLAHRARGSRLFAVVTCALSHRSSMPMGGAGCRFWRRQHHTMERAQQSIDPSVPVRLFALPPRRLRASLCLTAALDLQPAEPRRRPVPRRLRKLSTRSLTRAQRSLSPCARLSARLLALQLVRPSWVVVCALRLRHCLALAVLVLATFVSALFHVGVPMFRSCRQACGNPPWPLINGGHRGKWRPLAGQVCWVAGIATSGGRGFSSNNRGSSGGGHSRGDCNTSSGPRGGCTR